MNEDPHGFYLNVFQKISDENTASHVLLPQTTVTIPYTRL